MTAVPFRHRGLGLGLAALLAAAPAPAMADDAFLSYDPVNELARNLLRGITIQVQQGPLAFFGQRRLVRLYATASRGSAGLERGGLSEGQIRRALPDGATEYDAYRIVTEGEDAGDGRALVRALCRGSDRAWLVFGSVRPRRDLTVHAIGQVGEGEPVRCATLEYRWRGEWSMPPRDPFTGGDTG